MADSLTITDNRTGKRYDLKIEVEPDAAGVELECAAAS